MRRSQSEYQAFQRSLTRRLARELLPEAGPQGKALRSYYLAYLRDVADYEALATKDQLLRQVNASRVVLGGDYHALDQSKKTHVRILRRLAPRKRPVSLLLECFGVEHQAVVDAYLREDVSDLELLRAVDWRHTWGFAWPPYRELLRLARRRKLRVVALNGPRGVQGSALRRRDRHMAGVIAAEAARDPAGLAYVVVGDWHLARENLPARLAPLLDPDARVLLIYQNSDAVYWKLASRGLEQATDVVRVRPGAYCVVNATPFVKLASYALWSGHRAQATRLAGEGLLLASPDSPVAVDDEPLDEAEPESDLADTIRMFVSAIAGFLDLGAHAADVTILTHDDQNLLHRLLRDLRLSDEDLLHEIAVLLINNRSFYLPRLRTIYLGVVSPNAMADMAARHLYHEVSRSGRLPRDPRAAFYVRVLRETVTFLGAKLINPKRPYRRRADFEAVLAEPRARTPLGPDRERLLVAGSYLAHRRLEKRALAGRRLPGPTARIYALKPIIRHGVTRALGQALGHKLHDGMVLGRIPKGELSALFHEDWCRHPDPARRYLELVRETRRIRALAKERDARL